MLQNLGKKGGKKMQLYTFQCKSLILVRKRGRKHCFGGSLLEIELPEWRCGNNQGLEAGGVAPKLLLSAGAEPSGAMRRLLELPTWERWEQGHGADAVLWHIRVLMSLGQQGWVGKHMDPARWGTCQPGKKGQLQSQKREDCREQEWSTAASWKWGFPWENPFLSSGQKVGLILSHSLQVWDR